MSKKYPPQRVWHNGRTTRIPFSNDIDSSGAEYDMDKVSQLLDEKISIDSLRQHLKNDDIKNSRKRANNDELKYTQHYHPNEDVHVNHLFSLDKNYSLNTDMDYKLKKDNSQRKLKANENINDDGIVLNTSAGQVQLNNRLAEKFMHGKKRLKVKNQYVRGDDLLNFSDENIANKKEGNYMQEENKYITIPVHDRSTNKDTKYKKNEYIIDTTLLNKNDNIKTNYPYGELAMPSNGKTVINGDYDFNIDWNKTICTKFNDTSDDTYQYDLPDISFNQSTNTCDTLNDNLPNISKDCTVADTNYLANNEIDNLAVPEKYYQDNQNVPRTADEWENLNLSGINRFKEALPSANVVSDNNALTEKDEINISNVYKTDIDTNKNNINNDLFSFKDSISATQDSIVDYSKLDLTNFKINLDEKYNTDIFKLANNDNLTYSLYHGKDKDKLNDTNKLSNDDINKLNNINDKFEKPTSGLIGNGINYSPSMHVNVDNDIFSNKIDLFNQQKIHQEALKKYGENPVKNNITNVNDDLLPGIIQTDNLTANKFEDSITAVKAHAGMTASIALAVKLRDMKELVTEFAKNVNKIDHCVYDQMNDTLFRMLKCVAKIKRKSHHKTTIYELDADCEFFRDLIKTSVKLQYLSPKKGLYGRLVAAIEEIGKIIGGFIKNINKYEK